MRPIFKTSAPDRNLIESPDRRYYILNKYVILFSLCGHASFLPVFFLLNRDIPFYNNILCVFLDIFLLYINSRSKLKTVHIIYIVEITYHTFFCNIIFGWEAGFIFYFFPLTFYIFLLRKYNYLKMIMFSILMILFVHQYFYLKASPPQFPVTIIPVWLIYFLNAGASFIALTFITSQFTVIVNKAENTILTAMKKAEEGERAKSVFLANMSHEIRSPLNSIIGMINLSLLSNKDKEKKQYLHIAKDSADHLLTVINDILDYSKIEVNRMSLNLQVFDLHYLVKNTMMAMDSSIYDRNLNMKYEIAETVPESVEGDPSRIRQVLINLISNAIKFTDNGSIFVKCKNISGDADPCTIEFSVEDTGVGIPEDKIGSIFNRFSQIEEKETKKYSGTGLGLAISKDLIELMGGSIRVVSTPGCGSIFTFQISLHRAVEEEKTSSMSDKMHVECNVASLNVLIAEDIFTNWLVYERYMQILGHSFKIVENGNLVLDELEQNSYDLILMDVEMPEMNGEETLKMIRTGIRGGNKDIPVIAMTGYSKNDLKATDYTFTGFLFKPVELEHLERKINEIMCKEQAGLKLEEV